MRGEPLPPLLEIPARVQDLKVEQIGGRLHLTFTPPTRTTEGTLAKELERIELRGAFIAADGELTDFGAQSQRIGDIASDQLESRRVFQSIYDLNLNKDQVGQRVYFAVQAFNRRAKDDGFSNVASAEIVDLPETPINLEATLTEPAIELHWKPAERSVFGGSAPSPDGYEVYRADAGSPSPAQLLGTATSPSYQDKNFAFGSSYVYTVRAFVKRGDSTARTPESNRVEIAAVDRFPPAAPKNVSAIAVSGAVELAWSPNGESDLAGYNIYRSEGQTPTRLNSDLITLPLYRDTTVKAGSAYRYVVKAVDQTGNEGPASAEAIATAE